MFSLPSSSWFLKLNQLLQSQTDSLFHSPVIRSVPSSSFTFSALMRACVPDTFSVTGPESFTSTRTFPTMSSSFTVLALEVLVGHVTQSLFAAWAGRISAAATAAPMSMDFRRCCMGQSAPYGAVFYSEPANRVFTLVVYRLQFRYVSHAYFA